MFSITTYEGPAPETNCVQEIQIIAYLGKEAVGYMEGYVADLASYGSQSSFRLDMDAVSQTTYDAAEAVLATGSSFWRRRGLLLFLDTAEVSPEHRLKGLARAMTGAMVAAAKTGRRSLDIIAQPYPLDMKIVKPEDVKGRQEVTKEEWDAEGEAITKTWLKLLPCLCCLGKGGLEGDRLYYFGRLSG